MKRAANQRPPVKSSVETNVDGKSYTGTWYISGDLLTVEYAGRSKSARPGAGPEALARIILGELVRESTR